VATGLNTSRGSLLVAARATSTDGGVALAGRLRAVAGVARVTAVTEAGADTAAAVTVTVAPCAMLTAIAEVGNCRDGDAFVVTGNGRPPAQRSLARLLGSAGASALSRARRVPPVTDPSELPTDAVLLTPGAAGPRLRADSLTALIALRPGDGGAEDRLRDAVAQIDPLATVTTLTGISHVLLAGTVAILLMIGASLLVAAVEQLRERRGALAALAAAGTRRSTLAWSVTWQTAIPMAIGLALAVALGTTLGGVLMAIVHLRVSIDWTAIGVLVGAGALVVTGASLLTVPLLWRLAGPDELRAE
jgi:Ca2+/Na+ antiporter